MPTTFFPGGLEMSVWSKGHGRRVAFTLAFAAGIGLSTFESAEAAQPIGECSTGTMHWGLLRTAIRMISSGACSDPVMLCWQADADNEEHPYGVACLAAE